MSSLGVPKFAISRHLNICRRMAFYRGVYPHFFDFFKIPSDSVNREVIHFLRDLHYLEDGNWVILTRGDIIGEGGGTNVLKILRVGDCSSN